MQPASVTLYNANEAYQNMITTAIRRRINKRTNYNKYKCNDYVRISRTKGTFEKGYEKNWSEEIFRISRVLHRQDLRVYEIRDLEDESIEGIFYPEELTKVHEKRMSEQQEFKINRVLQTKGRGAKKQFFVSWVGYPEKFNSWIPAAEIHDLRN